MDKVINYERQAHNITANMFYFESVVRDFYEHALKACGECPIMDDNKRGLKIFTTYIPKGKKGEENLRVQSVTYDAARWNGSHIEFRVAEGAEFFDKGEWVKDFGLDMFGTISDTIMKHIKFPKAKTCVEVMASATKD